MTVTETLLKPYLAKAAGKPLITHYDDAEDSRIELSAATLANWAAKTANWLVDEFDIEPGDPVCVRLPAHWQTAGVLLGALWCGAHVITDTDARVAFVGPDASDDPKAEATAVVAMDPFGQGLGRTPPNGALDYLVEVRIAGDDFLPLAPASLEDPALGPLTGAEVLTAARGRAAALGIGAGDRVLSTRPWTVPDGVVDALLAPLSVGATLVQVTGADPARLDGHRSAERTTVDLLD